MSVITEINGIVERLDEQERLLVLEVIKRFLPYEIPTDEELQHMKIAREEYARGDVGSWDDIE